MNTSGEVKEQIGQLLKDKEILETEKRSLLDEKKHLEENLSKVSEEVCCAAYMEGDDLYCELILLVIVKVSNRGRKGGEVAI